MWISFKIIMFIFVLATCWAGLGAIGAGDRRRNARDGPGPI